MKVEFESESRIDIEMTDGKTLCILQMPHQQEVIIIFGGVGHRYVKEVQNRADGHSSITLTKQA